MFSNIKSEFCKPQNEYGCKKFDFSKLQKTEAK